MNEETNKRTLAFLELRVGAKKIRKNPDNRSKNIKTKLMTQLLKQDQKDLLYLPLKRAMNFYYCLTDVKMDTTGPLLTIA